MWTSFRCLSYPLIRTSIPCRSPHAISETPPQGDGTTLTLIARQEKLPCTQVNVALEFLKQQGIVDVRHRRCYPGTTCVFEDAMVEFLVLDQSFKTD